MKQVDCEKFYMIRLNFYGRHDTQYNGIQHKNTQHNDTQHVRLNCDTKHYTSLNLLTLSTMDLITTLSI
jgi:hypothetical protein